MLIYYCTGSSLDAKELLQLKQSILIGFDCPLHFLSSLTGSYFRQFLKTKKHPLQVTFFPEKRGILILKSLGLTAFMTPFSIH